MKTSNKQCFKRLVYISKMSSSVSNEDIQQLGDDAAQFNRRTGITGILVYFQGMFFQIIEGPESAIDQLWGRIRNDPRHTDVVCLRVEDDVSERLFPKWSMKAINLDDNVDELIRPIRILLKNVTESHTIIERYTQPTILKILNQGINPLTVPIAKVNRIILFIDMVAFTSLSEELPLDALIALLNTWLSVCSRVISDRGGEVNKFIGDGVLAYFDVSQVDDAIQSCLDILQELDMLRSEAAQDSWKRSLYCGFGLAEGMVIEGNMGSKIKTDYTLIGDAVNTASRLQSLTRQLERAVVVSEGVKQRAAACWSFVLLGTYDLKGKEKRSAVYTVDHELVNNFVRPPRARG